MPLLMMLILLLRFSSVNRGICFFSTLRGVRPAPVFAVPRTSRAALDALKRLAAVRASVRVQRLQRRQRRARR